MMIKDDGDDDEDVFFFLGPLASRKVEKEIELLIGIGRIDSLQCHLGELRCGFRRKGF